MRHPNRPDQDHAPPTDAERLGEGRVFEAIANSTYDWETWFDGAGRPCWINPAVERLTGYTVGECLAMRDFPLPIVHEEDRASVAELLAAARLGSSGNDVELRILRKDGSAGWGAVSWQPLSDPDHRVTGFRTSIRDIAMRKQAEDALKLAMAEAERANRAKSRFLAAASHDLRQPLQAMAMYMATLSRQRLDGTAQGIVADLYRCLDAANDLLAGLMDVSRLDAGIVVPRPEAVAIVDLLDVVETEFRGPASQKWLDLRIVASSETIWSDPTLLANILRNLVSNAIRYTEAGRVLVGVRRRGRHALIEVWDSGCGIPADKHDAIFEEFYQLENPERDRRKGLGLGLAIVRRLAALLGHRVTVGSKVGKGSVFAIEVPVVSEAAGQPRGHRAVEPADPFAGRLIAVVDDEPLQLVALSRFLESCGAEVVAGHSAEEVEARLGAAAGRIAAIVADYRLREHATGWDAIASIRRAAGREAPAVILTGDIESSRLIEAKMSGCALLHKPVDPALLIETLAAAIKDGRRA